MSTQKNWSKDQKDVTREILSTVDIVAFSFDISGKNKGCTLNHLDGRYGYIKLNDALSNSWNIYDYESDQLLDSFKTIETLIQHGWKVST